VASDGGGGVLQRGKMKGEVRRTINRVYGPWGGGSPRKGSAVVFPHDSSEPAMDEMQGRGRTEGVA
jgi:hypothetical protein